MQRQRQRGKRPPRLRQVLQKTPYALCWVRAVVKDGQIYCRVRCQISVSADAAAIITHPLNAAALAAAANAGQQQQQAGESAGSGMHLHIHLGGSSSAAQEWAARATQPPAGNVSSAVEEVTGQSEPDVE